MLAIVVAVREELRAVTRRMPRVERVSAGGIVAYSGTLAGCPVLAAHSGMGAQRAEAATRALLGSERRPDALLIAGFCAGIRPRVAHGDLIVAERVIDCTAAERELLCPDGNLWARAHSFAEPPIHAGGLVTAGAVLRTAADKRRAAQNSPDALAADMETAAVARVAVAAGVPWVAVRAVSDGFADDLPLDFTSFVDPRTGEVAPARLAAYVLLHPRCMPGLVRLGGRAAFAARNLGAFVEAFARDSGPPSLEGPPSSNPGGGTP